MRYWESAGKRRSSARSRGRGRAAATRGAKRSVALGGSIREYPFLRTFYQHQAEIGVGLQKFLFFLVIATLLYAFVLGDGGAIRLTTLRGEKIALEREVAALTADTEALRLEIERLKTDPFAMEKLGRERYGYIRPGERVYKIIPTPRPE